MKTTKKAKKPTVINKKVKKTASNTRTRKPVAKELTFTQHIARFGRKKFIALVLLLCLLIFTVLIATISMSSIIADNNVSNTAVLAANNVALVAPTNLQSGQSTANGSKAIIISWETTTANNGAYSHSLYCDRILSGNTGKMTRVLNSKVLTIGGTNDSNYKVVTKKRWFKKYYYHTYIINKVSAGYRYSIDVFAHSYDGYTYVYKNTSIDVK